MNFIEKILKSIGNFGEFVGDLFEELVDFLAKPLALLLALLEGIMYFIVKFFEVVIEFIMLFVALFQFFFSIVAGLFRTVFGWLGFAPSSHYPLPSASKDGFEFTLEQIGGTGLLTVIPNICIVFIWIVFAYKILSLLGDKGGIKS